jgi:ABC-type glutathione transport system ATPase component
MRPAAFLVSAPRHHQILESHVTTLLSPELKNGSFGQPVLPIGSELTAPATIAVPALLIEDVTKRFVVSRKKPPVTAISHVSMRLERGDIQGILGANGSGKSTLIRLVSGLLTLDEGRVEVFGHDIVREEMAVKRLINRVSVDAAFFKKLSPMENLLFAARLYGLDGRTA